MVLPDFCEFRFFGDAPRDVQLRGLRVEVGLGDADGEVCVNAGGGGGTGGGFGGYAAKGRGTKEIIWSD